MSEECRVRVGRLQRGLRETGADLFLLADPDSIFYFSGAWGYLGAEWGRATLLLIPCSGDPVFITPAMEAEMVRAMTWVEDVREWTDGVAGEWKGLLEDYLARGQAGKVLVERHRTPVAVLDAAREAAPRVAFEDGAALIGRLRAVKSPAEIDVMRQAGQVAVAMLDAGRAAIAEGVPEYEIALAVIAGGTRKAAEFLEADATERLFSPTIYNLQVLQSGHDTCMVHRRSSVRRIERGDPVYFCFCGLANYKRVKLGFDREFFVGSVTETQAKLYATAVRAQQAALAELRPGATCEEVHAAAEEVYRGAGLGLAYRTGRGIGYSYLEEPQIKRGDRTPIEAGMTFAVDGGITIPGEFGARIGDSVVVTAEGFEYLTPYARELTIL